jgi:hypothetical protein
LNRRPFHARRSPGCVLSRLAKVRIPYGEAFDRQRTRLQIGMKACCSVGRYNDPGVLFL